MEVGVGQGHPSCDSQGAGIGQWTGCIFSARLQTPHLGEGFHTIFVYVCFLLWGSKYLYVNIVSL